MGVFIRSMYSSLYLSPHQFLEEGCLELPDGGISEKYRVHLYHRRTRRGGPGTKDGNMHLRL